MSYEMMQIIEGLLQLTMIGMTGLYFIFSNTIMTSLKNHQAGAQIMVRINHVILNPVFMFFFIGSAIAALYLMFYSQGLQFFSGLIFLTGTTIVTMLKNVPLNNRLRDAQTETDENPVWDEYLVKWVFWNHIRSASAIIASFLLVV